jgi:hypothetical protein
VPGLMTAAAQEKAPLELRSDTIIAGLPLPESVKGVYGFRLTAQVDKKGEGAGTLELNPNAPAYDELGLFVAGTNLPDVKLECALKFVKKKKIMRPEAPRLGAPLVEEEWSLFEIGGPKITSRLFLATNEKTSPRWALLLVHGKDGKVQFSVPVRDPGPPQPCHPGCFPAGTPIRVSGGSQPIERVRVGDLVTTVGPDGVVASRKVASVFVTKNRLVELRTDGGSLVTTETQPIALVGGGVRAVGELKAGDRVYRWDGRERRIVTVRSVSPTGREERVFNLVLGDPAIFIADGFLVRSKPPAIAPAVDAEALPLNPRPR